jgi:hypothetical protein
MAAPGPLVKQSGHSADIWKDGRTALGARAYSISGGVVEPRLRALSMGIVFTAVAVGFAYAVPRAVESVVADQVVNQIGAEDPPPDRNEPIDVGGGGEEGPGDNHGAAVSAAAHCDLAGAAHGEFVREVAHDKDITVAEVESLCEAAVANQEASAHGRPDKPGKPDRPGKSQDKKNGNGPGGADKRGGADTPPKFEVPDGGGEPDEPGKGHSGEHGKPDDTPGGESGSGNGKGGGGKK